MTRRARDKSHKNQQQQGRALKSRKIDRRNRGRRNARFAIGSPTLSLASLNYLFYTNMAQAIVSSML